MYEYKTFSLNSSIVPKKADFCALKAEEVDARARALPLREADDNEEKEE